MKTVQCPAPIIPTLADTQVKRFHELDMDLKEVEEQIGRAEKNTAPETILLAL